MKRKRMLIYTLVGLAVAFLLLRLAVIPLASGVPARFEKAPDLTPHTQAPNLVSSLAADEARRVAPFALGSEHAQAAFVQLMERLAAQPGARLVTRTDGYAHLTFSTAVWGFIDDVEVQFDAEAGVAQVKSASRLGYSDLGANRKRVEALRARVKK